MVGGKCCAEYQVTGQKATWSPFVTTIDLREAVATLTKQRTTNNYRVVVVSEDCVPPEGFVASSNTKVIDCGLRSTSLCQITRAHLLEYPRSALMRAGYRFTEIAWKAGALTHGDGNQDGGQTKDED
ncbi:MAG TPA: hypothetical protein DDX19_11070 [Rhodopirellula baltica]|uniref:Uncharacterized protein n=1 Tax=Rhodopirellula baltica (strain DSM 10527 / NCIMB 13988 / SH1) TaxID=243090 RepID=Q7UGF1_RHOBA|nr:hypothetical protein [Rhodopirellula baltica]CAD78378.1 hypothetical protein RB5261 [Rhodopirellula baltica SH 1]HBE63260.1 hypothetical protein [Rhodopirellula baltica]